jgi:phosphate/sulfate permease
VEVLTFGRYYAPVAIAVGAYLATRLVIEVFTSPLWDEFEQDGGGRFVRMAAALLGAAVMVTIAAVASAPVVGAGILLGNLVRWCLTLSG